MTPLTSFFGVQAASVVCHDFTVDSSIRVSVDSLESEAQRTTTTMASRPLLTPRFRTKFDRSPEQLEFFPEEDERSFSVSSENHEDQSSRWRRSDHSVEEEELLLRSFESMSSRELRYLLEALSVSRESDSYEMERKLEFARRLARREAAGEGPGLVESR